MSRDLGNGKAFVRAAATHAAEMYEWYANLPTVSVADFVPDEEAAKHTAVFSADMINGFCKEGALASPRVDAISQPVADLFARMYGVGVRKFVLAQDAHHEQAKEFKVFPPHAIQGTPEAETITELLALSFSEIFEVCKKNSLSPAVPGIGGWFGQYCLMNDFQTAIAVGNCTDLCLRELAMYLCMWANTSHCDVRIIIPANCVQTFHMPPEVARAIEQEHGLSQGAVKPHPGDLMHVQALYEMSRNGIEVVKEIV